MIKQLWQTVSITRQIMTEACLSWMNVTQHMQQTWFDHRNNGYEFIRTILKMKSEDESSSQIVHSLSTDVVLK